MADWVHLPHLHGHECDLGLETELWIKVKELLFDNTLLSKVKDDKKSWYT